jgi:Ca2+-binding RTX toxin-like protein
MPDGTIKYRARNTVDPSGINGQSVYNGTAGVDRIYGGNDNDTFWGGEGNDIIEGGDGADIALGGEGDDIITDLAGDDVPKGGPGNDAIDAGPGLDILMGGDGKDFTNGGANANETFAGAGDDFVMLGESLDAAFGDSGDDWEEGGNQPDLMQGDSGNLFFLDDSQKPGHDILVGQGGDDDYDMEGGDDIGVGGPGIEKVAGASGYDWEIGQGDPQAQDLDLALPIPPLDILTVGVRDKFNEVEALSGGKLDDKLRGDDLVPSAVGGAGFIGCDVLDQAGVDRIAGLGDLVTALPTLTSDVVAASASKDCPLLTGTNVWGDGNILLGGGGSDLLEGRGANDIIDGDRYLGVRLSVRTDPNNAATEIGSASIEAPGQSAMTSRYLKDANGNLTGPTLQEAVFAGTVNPGNIVAVREILTGSGGTDSAVFTGPEADYTVTTTGGDGTLGSPGSTTTVTDNVGTDGTDTVRNVERLVFADTVAPSAPVIGAATAGNGQATVNFIPAAGGVATSFEVRVVNAAGTQVGALQTADAGATSLVVTGLTNGTPVRFQVRALNAIGTSAFSALSNSVTPSAPVLASAPAIGTATAGNAQVTVRWTAPAAVPSAPVTQFRVRVFVGTGATPAREITVGNVTNTVVTGLINGTGYTFDVSAINAAGTGAASARTPLITPRTEFVAPTITARTPAAGATSVSQTNNLTVTFSEPVANVTTGTVVLRLGTTVIPASVTYNNATRTATVNPTANLLADRTYSLAVSSVRDTAGNTIAFTSWQFTTGPAPTVVSVTPAIGATNVSRTANVTVRYSEPVTNVNTATVVLRRGGLTGPVVTATVTYNAANRTATLNPSATLVANTTYTMATSSVLDLAGNPLAFRSWTFRTGAV